MGVGIGERESSLQLILAVVGNRGLLFVPTNCKKVVPTNGEITL